MKLKISYLILFCCLVQYAKAQDKGTVIFDVAPLNATIKIDNQLLTPAAIGEPKTKIDLPIGTYKVQIWAYGMELYEEEVVIKSNDYTIVSAVLKPRKDYITYNKALDKYHDDKRKIRQDDKFKLIPFYLGMYCVMQTGVNIPLINKYKNEANNLREKHPQLLLSQTLSESRSRYETLQRQHNNLVYLQRGINYVGVPAVIGLSSYAIYRFRQKYNMLEKPFFNDTIPFSNVDLDFNIQPSLFNNYQNFSVVITYNF